MLPLCHLVSSASCVGPTLCPGGPCSCGVERGRQVGAEQTRWRGGQSSLTWPGHPAFSSPAVGLTVCQHQPPQACGWQELNQGSQDQGAASREQAVVVPGETAHPQGPQPAGLRVLCGSWCRTLPLDGAFGRDSVSSASCALCKCVTCVYSPLLIPEEPTLLRVSA